ncbi:UDP-N-acetylmuramate--L-alanine ligase [Patescibacteria group bacterium]|nr:MAG: UDP-N-acetylmuramate--L-alanine ligase [Patescibacteria group bacterium]
MRIHMIGIGGIGMSALAQLYIRDGHTVSGSDREVSPTTELLETKGIRVSIPQKSENVPVDAERIVYSDAVWDDNPERIRAKELELKQISYFEALGEVSEGKRTIAVTGTHGKTTTTALIAKILKDAGKNPTAIVGSIVPEFGSNFLSGTSDIFVIEACEYKDHLLKLSPAVLVLTNVEWDHTDWFPTLDAEIETFAKSAEKLPSGGALITNIGGSNIAPVVARTKAQVISYADEVVPELQLVGEFNLMNARAAKSAVKALFPDIADSVIDKSLSEFKGTWRRFEVKGETKEGALVIDDYAHHPSAIEATLKATRVKFPNKKIIVAFHPHLYSRTRDLMDGFVHAFVDADEVVFAPIYPAREEPIVGVTSDALAEKIRATGKQAQAFHSLEEVETYLRSVSAPDTILMTMGAGDIYKVADALVLS